MKSPFKNQFIITFRYIKIFTFMINFRNVLSKIHTLHCKRGRLVEENSVSADYELLPGNSSWPLSFFSYESSQGFWRFQWECHPINSCIWTLDSCWCLGRFRKCSLVGGSMSLEAGIGASNVSCLLQGPLCLLLVVLRCEHTLHWGSTHTFLPPPSWTPTLYNPIQL